MKTLNRLILVNWYLLSATQIEIRGNAALVGANGSGKSSIIDAIQTLLLGGDQNHIRFNASATGKKSKRTLREYCLGIVRDPSAEDDENTAFAPRERAITYIVCSFFDDQTNEETVVGLALHASLLENSCHIAGRFIAPRLAVNLRDFIEDVGGNDKPIPWERVREELSRRCREQRKDLITPTDAISFVTRMGQELGNEGRSLEPKRFAKNLQNAITFAPIDDVSEFVRRYILEHKPIRVRDLQDSLRRYREIADKTREVKERIEALKVTLQFYLEANKCLLRAQQYDWVEKESAVARLGQQVAELEVAINSAQTALEELEKVKASLKLQREAQADRQAQIKAELMVDTAEARAKELQAQKENQELKRQQVTDALVAAHSNLSSIVTLHDYRDQCSVELCNRLDESAKLIPSRDSQNFVSWPDDPEAIMRLIQEMLPNLAEIQGNVSDAHQKLIAEQAGRNQKLVEMRSEISALEKGEAPLSTNTRRLIEILASHSITSTPLCDLIDVTDERWRDSVESFLSKNREALIVDPNHAVDAVRHYRREGKGLYGARVVNTRKTLEWQEKAEKGSLAEIIRTQNPHARAYVNRLLGRVMRVESEADLVRHDRAITTDGMVNSNGSVQRMQQERPLLGRNAREKRLKSMQAEFQSIAEIQTKAGKEVTRANALKDRLVVIASKWESIPDLRKSAAERAIAGKRIAEITEELASLDLSTTQGLRAELEAGQVKLEALDKNIQENDNTEIGLRTQLNNNSNTLGEANVKLQAANDERRMTEGRPGFNQEEASKLFEKLLAEATGDYKAVEGKARGRAEANRKDTVLRFADALQSLNDYAHRHSALLPGGGLPPEQRHAELSAWTQDNLKTLEETQLADLTKQAEDARTEAEKIFNSQFIGQLRDNLHKVADSLDELNRNLQKREFHGEVYRFKHWHAPDYEPIIRWVMAASEVDRENVGSLFDRTLSPDNEHYEGRRRIQELLLSTENTDALELKLADYRNYFQFDVEMKDVKGRSSTMLSKRLGKGSGGEHQTPFYVAISASLAATYRIDRGMDGQPRSGMALALFDEAFSKLDVQNTSNALQFLRDLGMQTLVAAPNEKYAPLAEEMDTMVNVYRDGDAVEIEVKHLKPAARALLAKDNPFKQANAQ